jgi:hypothetical protein
MKHFLVRFVSLLVIALAASSPALAEKKERPKKADVQRKCENNLVFCQEKCDKLIDINNQVENCNKDCDRKYGICMRHAENAERRKTETGDAAAGGSAVAPK